MVTGISGDSRPIARLRKLVGPTLLFVFFAGTAGTFWLQYKRAESLYQQYPLQGTAVQAIMIEEFRKVYSEEVVKRVQEQGIEITHAPGDNKHAIPLPATTDHCQ